MKGSCRLSCCQRSVHPPRICSMTTFPLFVNLIDLIFPIFLNCLGKCRNFIFKFQLIYFTLHKITLMADTKQISATIDSDLAEWVANEARADRRTFSEMIGILLEEAKAKREK